MGAQMARSPALGVIRFRTKLKAENPTTPHMSQRDARDQIARSPARANTMTAMPTRSAAWISAAIRNYERYGFGALGGMIVLNNSPLQPNQSDQYVYYANRMITYEWSV